MYNKCTILTSSFEFPVSCKCGILCGQLFRI